MMESPIASITKYFTQKQGSSGQLSLDKEVKTTVGSFLEQGNLFQAEEVFGLVSAIDIENSPLERLDAPGAVIFCSILLHAEVCLPVQRGIYLLAVSSRDLWPTVVEPKQASLRSASSNGEQSNSGQHKKKTSLQQSLIPLLSNFIKADCDEEIRRWVCSSYHTSSSLVNMLADRRSSIGIIDRLSGKRSKATTGAVG
ncbi:uncharacterized protein KY384_008993 [Bacidia gigantensis]|uniref:uncharacterized protein n=1 Tax=Bacidia gigantensis TaxID=2732470 RepID=UPI001D051DD2|nr:uncharacterized protein KY384_008993 [Bacidia gigantensis]KAG8525349.1 hypothetical protein KY384_008993 [Bacidia gigantensis]